MDQKPSLFDFKIDNNGNIICTEISKYDIRKQKMYNNSIKITYAWKSTSGTKTIESKNLDRCKNGHIVSFDNNKEKAFETILTFHQEKMRQSFDEYLKEKAIISKITSPNKRKE